MNIAALVLLGATLAYACFQHAGVVPREWNPCVAAIGLIAAVYFLFPRRERSRRLDRIIVVSMLALLAVAGLQIIPLPVGLVRFLSPSRVEVLRAAGPVMGGLPHRVTLSAVPAASAQALLSLCAYAVVFLLVRELTLRLRHRPWAAIWPLLIVTALEAALGFLQAYLQAGDAQATGTYNSRDHFAGLLEMVLPFPAMYAVAVLHRSRQSHESPAVPAVQASLGILLAALLLIGGIFSLSRMGFLCALAALFVAGSLTLSVRGWRVDCKTSAPLWRRMVPTAAVGSVVLLGFVFLPTDPLIARFSDLARTEDINADTRAQLWRDTVPLIKDYALFGCGFGAYESCFLKYKTVAPMSTADFAHNDYVQVLAELGAIGFLAGLTWVLRILAGAGRQVFYAGTIDDRYRAIACVAAMIAMLLHSLVDFNMYVPANAMVFAWIAGVASAHLGRSDSSRMPSPDIR
jgi:O-antigen ligase